LATTAARAHEPLERIRLQRAKTGIHLGSAEAMQGAAIIPTAFPRFDRWRASAFFATLIAAAFACNRDGVLGVAMFGPARVHIAPAAPADPAATLIASGLLTAVHCQQPHRSRCRFYRATRVFLACSPKRATVATAVSLPSGPKLVAAARRSLPARHSPPCGPTASTCAKLPAFAPSRYARRRSNCACATTSKATPARIACAPPAGFKGLVVALNTELVGG